MRSFLCAVYFGQNEVNVCSYNNRVAYFSLTLEFEYAPENVVLFQHQQFDYPNVVWYVSHKIVLLLEFTCTKIQKFRPKNYLAVAIIICPHHGIWHTYLPFSQRHSNVRTHFLRQFYMQPLACTLHVSLSQFIFHLVDIFFSRYFQCENFSLC